MRNLLSVAFAWRANRHLDNCIWFAEWHFDFHLEASGGSIPPNFHAFAESADYFIVIGLDRK